MSADERELVSFERLARKVKSLPEKNQRDICLIIQGYLACNTANKIWCGNTRMIDRFTNGNL